MALQRTQEHLIKPEGVCSVMVDQIIRVNNIMFRFRHLFYFPATDVFTIFEYKFGIFKFWAPFFECLKIEHIIIHKIHIYMNRSGIAVQRVLSQYAESPENLVVIYDDLDLDVGRLRIRKRGGHGGHKGLQSIIEQLATKEFVRIRMGIGRPAQTEHPDKQMLQEKVVDYVLQPFDQDEQPLIRDSLKRSVEAIKLIVADQLDTAMNLYNRR